MCPQEEMGSSQSKTSRKEKDAGRNQKIETIRGWLCLSISYFFFVSVLLLFLLLFSSRGIPFSKCSQAFQCNSWFHTEKLSSYLTQPTERPTPSDLTNQTYCCSCWSAADDADDDDDADVAFVLLLMACWLSVNVSNYLDGVSCLVVALGPLDCCRSDDDDDAAVAVGAVILPRHCRCLALAV